MNLQSVCQILQRIAPLELAEDWDNVGLLAGNRAGLISRVMTCLTITPAVVAEAEMENIDLLVSHHPLPFKPLSKLTFDTTTGSMLSRLIAAKVAVYSAHTAYDSAIGGINDQWCDRLGLNDAKALIPAKSTDLTEQDASLAGAGRCGTLSDTSTAGRLLNHAAGSVGATRPRMVGAADRPVFKIAVACGSGGSFVSAAKRQGCDALLTGEATFHQCLEAEAQGVALLMLGHFASERMGMERLAECLSDQLPGVCVHASTADRDPITVDPISQNP